MIFDFPESAFSTFEEPLSWTSRRSGTKGVFNASVFHGADIVDAAGANRGKVPANQWTVVSGPSVGLISNIRAGDVLSRVSGQTLNVQQVSRDSDFGWVMTCTEDERSPK